MTRKRRIHYFIVGNINWHKSPGLAELYLTCDRESKGDFKSWDLRGQCVM